MPARTLRSVHSPQHRHRAARPRTKIVRTMILATTQVEDFWDAAGWQSFVSDPEVPPIMQEAGHKGRPQAAELAGRYVA
jgi:hypothetical protein